MKTKELIRLLQEEDPSGELECNVDGKDIYFVERTPGYRDGAYKVLIRDDKKKPYYDIDGISIRRDGFKIMINTMGYDDVLLDNPDAIVEYSDPETKQHYEESVEKCRKENRELIEEVNKQFDGEF